MPRPKRKKEDGPLLNGQGYIIVHCPGHPRANNSGYVFEHILKAEKVLGRFLKRGEDVHHYGERTDNNKIVICDSSTYHKLLHIRERALKATGDVYKRKCIYCKRYDDIENLTEQGPTSANFYHKPCRNVHLNNIKARKNMNNHRIQQYPMYAWLNAKSPVTFCDPFLPWEETNNEN